MKCDHIWNALDKRAAGTLFIDTAEWRDSEVETNPTPAARQIMRLTMVGAVNTVRNRAAIWAYRLDRGAVRANHQVIFVFLVV